MPYDVKIPAVGESITEGTLSRWLVADGAIVSDSTPLFELETDKITTEVQAGAAGKVSFKVKEGTVLPIGALVAAIDISALGTPGNAPAPTAAPAAAPKSAAPVPAVAPAGQPLSPAVKQLVADTKIDPAKIAGTGKDGRVTKGDVLQDRKTHV